MNNDLACLPTETVETCVNCTRSDSRRDSRFEVWLCLKPPYQIRKCVGCALRWLSPRPTGAGYEIVYNADNYFGAQAGEGIAYEGVLAARNLQFETRLNEITKRFPGRKSLNILDFGAATGEFVACARRLGHCCVGVELSEDARAIAHSRFAITLYEPENLPEFSSGYDLIHMNHVFEHVPNPATHLAWCSRMLADGGMLLIEVPQQFCNHIDRLKRILGRGGKLEKFSAFSLHHTYFYTARSLLEIISRSGFRPIAITTNVIGPRLGTRKNCKSRLMDFILRVADLAGRGGDNIELIAVKSRIQ